MASLVVLIALTIWVLKPGGKDEPIKATAADRTSHAATTTPAAPTTANSTPHPSSSSASSSSRSSSSSSSSRSSSSAPEPCSLSKLAIKAVVGGDGKYKVGDQPLLMLQVTNTGTKSCVQDLADSQIELKVYNGESRVWGSHDCQIEPGTSPSTLMSNQAVRVSLTWSGLSSQPECAGTRQRVGAGTYTLYATLAGKQGAAANFSIS